jgi:hypothetical protein
MAVQRLIFLFTVVVLSVSAQTAVPFFTPEGLLPHWGKHLEPLMPNEVATMYGRNLAPTFMCPYPPPSNGVYPTEICGVQVIVAGVPAQLLAVLEKQINFKVPAEAPTSGEAAIVVTVRGVSSQPVTVPFGKRTKVILSASGPAYVHMPVWIELDRPRPYDIAYPYRLDPRNFGGGRFEVRFNGVILKPFENPWREGQMMMNGNPNGSLAPAGSPRGRLPLHLQYHFDVPGKYEIRFIGTRLEFPPGRGMQTAQVDESDWTEIEILPYSEAEREKWIKERISKMPSSPGMLVGDAIPELLAVPDPLALSAVLPELYDHDDLVRRFTASSLTMFDGALLAKQLTALVRAKGPTEEIARIVDGNEELFEGGHQAFLALLPPFLNSDSALAQAGALQYLVWEPNHDWGRTPEIGSQRAYLVLKAAPAILEYGNPHVQQLLAEALGSVKSDASRDLLWKMIESGKSGEQSRIALTWVGDARDLPRLAALLTQAGSTYTSLPYSLHHAYGDAALPWLDRAARDTKQVGVRIACAQELIMANRVEGFRYLLQAVNESPSTKQGELQFMRDRFPELRDASADAVMAFLKSKAGVQ